MTSPIQIACRATPATAREPGQVSQSLDPSRESAQAPTHRMFCDDGCGRAIPKPGLCMDCLSERARIRKLKRTYKRMATPARAKRCRPKKARAA